MPNHVRNILTLTFNTNEEAADFYLKHVPNGNFDFNTLVPMPEVLNGTIAGSPTDDALALIAVMTGNPGKLNARFDRERQEGETDTVLALRLCYEDPERLKPGFQALLAIATTGYQDWYNWSLDNWGTKWNAYDHNNDLHENVVHLMFDTAWSPPEPIIEKIGELYPDAKIAHYAFDEGWFFAVDDGETFTPEDGDERTSRVHEICYGFVPEPEEEDEDA